MTGSTEGVRNRSVLALLLVLAICPYFVDLGGSSIWDANEAFYVETPREMIERRDYISPTFNYEPRLNKPILSYWIVAGFYHVFGVSVGVQRLPIALAAVVLIATAFVLAWAGAGGSPPRPVNAGRPASGGQAQSLHGEPAPEDRTAPPSWRTPAPVRMQQIDVALWAAIGLAIGPRLLMFSRRILIDVYISMFMGLTLLFFVLAERYPARRRTFLPLMYAAVGLGVLTKGPIALVLPVAVFALYLLVHRELGRIRTMMLPAGAAIVAALVVPYYAALYARHGWAPISSFLLGENLARFTDGVGVDSPRGPAFYLPVIFSDSFPWSMFLIAAAVWWLRDRRTADPADRAFRVRTLLWLWIAVIVLFFTASTAKQDLYIFPIVPAVAALGALAVVRGWTGSVRWAAVATGVLVAAAGGGMLYLIGSPNGVYGVDGAPWMGLAGLVGGAFISGAAVTNRRRAALVGIAVTFIVLDWIFVLRVLPGFERYKPVPGFASTLARTLEPEDLLVTYDEALPSLVYYLRRHVDPLFDAEELIAMFRGEDTVYAILSAENYDALASRIGDPTCEVERRPTFDVKLRNMLARDPLPELVLITNRCRGG